MQLEVTDSLDTRLAPEDFLPSAIVDGRYRLRRTIGTGGMSVVFEAEHLFTGRVVALKTLLPEFRHAPEVRQRMLRESTVLGAVRHPNVVAIVDAGIASDGAPYLVLEKLDGRPLDGVVRARRRVSEAEALHIVHRVALAVAAAHERGVLHRDINASNVMIVHDRDARHGESVRLIDFGVASAPAGDGRANLTKTGIAVGTSDYLAPEQLLGQGASIQTEVYALGLLLFECLTGELPFSGGYAQRLLQITSGASPVADAVRAGLSDAVAAILTKALAPETRKRFASARELANAILSSGMVTSELRLLRQTRAALVSPLRCRVDERVLEGQTADVSVGGLLCFLRRQVDVGAIVALRFAAPVSGNVIDARGLVRWTRRAARGSRYPHAAGVAFVDLDPAVAREIEHYLAAQLGSVK